MALVLRASLCTEDEAEEPLAKKSKSAEGEMTVKLQSDVTDSDVVQTDKSSSLIQQLLKPS